MEETASPAARRHITPRRIERVKGLVVRRVLSNDPSVGPFVLFDHYGPVAFEAGRGLDIGPHPHVGMATLTYLFEGEVLTRDNLGNAFTLSPGGAIWLMSGRGAAHSERTPAEFRQRPSRLSGMQLWCAIPPAQEGEPPSSTQFVAADLPVIRRGGTTLRVIAGSFGGARSPVPVLSSTCCVHAEMEPDATLELLPGEHAERGLYLAHGDASLDGEPLPPEEMTVLHEGERTVVAAKAASRLVLLGGAALGPRLMWSTVLARTQAGIEAAQAGWQSGRIASVVGEAERGGFPP